LEDKMNERILQLIEQVTSTQGPTPYNPLTFEVFDKEKFAELIVRECADLFEVEYGKYAVSGNTVAEVLKRHFGVEE